MSGLQQLCLSDPILLISVWCSSLPPFVIAGSVYSHEPAQKIHRILCSQFFDDFVVFPLPVTYSLLAPTPSTQYPFFNRAISISCLAMMSRSRSNSSNDLLCSAAYGLPFFGSSPSPTSSRYRFTQADTRLCPTPHFLSISWMERCSSKCKRMICSFSSLLHFRCGVPFFSLDFTMKSRLHHYL